MLYDPKWEKPEVKADPFSLDSLIAWLETMPTAGRYDFCDPYKCAAAQCLQFYGLDEFNSGLSLKRLHELGWYAAVNPMPRTFGAALARARAAQNPSR